MRCYNCLQYVSEICYLWFLLFTGLERAPVCENTRDRMRNLAETWRDGQGHAFRSVTPTLEQRYGGGNQDIVKKLKVHRFDITWHMFSNLFFFLSDSQYDCE